MSIINDALKKIEKHTRLPQNNSHQKRWLFWMGAGTVCLLGVILAINVFKGSTRSVSVQETISETDVPQSAFQMRKIGLAAPLRTSNFHLSGILYDSQRPLAIINERIVGEGALINGAQLLEIQSNYVKLSLKGKEFKLKIK